MTAHASCDCQQRTSADIVANFTDATESLAAIGAAWKQGQFKPADLANADATLRGLQHLLVELRAQDGIAA